MQHTSTATVVQAQVRADRVARLADKLIAGIATLDVGDSTRAEGTYAMLVLAVDAAVGGILSDDEMWEIASVLGETLAAQLQLRVAPPQGSVS